MAVNERDGIETFFSAEGAGVIGAVLVLGGLLFLLTSGPGFASLMFLLGLGAGAGSWILRSRRVDATPPAQVTRATDSTANRSDAADPLTRSERYGDRPLGSAGTASSSLSRSEIVTPSPTVRGMASTPPPPLLSTTNVSPIPSADEVASPALNLEISPPTPTTEVTDLVSLDSGVGHTVRMEGLLELAASRPIVHLVVTGDGPPRDVWFGKSREPWPSEISIGRNPPEGGASVAISSKAVSGLQAVLHGNERTFSVENLSGTNVTRVNGVALEAGEKRPLADGDRVEMGPVTIYFRLE